MTTKNLKYYYDQEKGIFVKEDQISINWLLSEVLQKPNLQITKISNNDLNIFVNLLVESDIRMPDGKHVVFWLKEQLTEKYNMAAGQRGETWAKISDRYRFIREQIDMSLIGRKNIKEMMEIKKNEEKIVEGLEENKMKCYFEPLN